MNKHNTNKEFIESLKEKSTKFIADAKEALETAKEKINETLTDENIEIVKKKALEYSGIAQEKATEFTDEAKEITQKTKTFFQKLFK